MSTKYNGWGLAWCFAITILLSAFLVFQVQPIISKAILPWFGGSPAVWTTCMLFFQVTLFAGYGYAHLIHRLRPMWQGGLHLVLLAAALILLPIGPDPSWKPTGVGNPTWRIMLLLAANVGLPYFLLSSTGPLVKAWFARAFEGRSPYRLYALSNAGSLAALLTYPFLVEPAMTIHAQGNLWSLGFCLFVLLCGYLAIRTWQQRSTTSDSEPRGLSPRQSGQSAPNWKQHITWLLLAAFASVMLLATTNHVCQDVAVIPFLWVIPLSLYLLSFIICFDKESWYACARPCVRLHVCARVIGVKEERRPLGTSPKDRQGEARGNSRH